MSNCNTGAGLVALLSGSNSNRSYGTILGSGETSQHVPLFAAATPPTYRAPPSCYGEISSSRSYTNWNWKDDFFYTWHFFNIFVIALILLGGIIVAVWLFIDLPGYKDICEPHNLHLVTRHEWGAAKAIRTVPHRKSLATLAVITQTGTPECNSTNSCQAAVKFLQSFYIGQNFSDILYSFLVGGDGHTYEGRGWDTVGAFEPRVDDIAIEIAVIGNFKTENPPRAQMDQARSLLQEGFCRRKLTHNYRLIADEQISSSTVQSTILYEIIKSWPHWDSCRMDYCRVTNHS